MEFVLNKVKNSAKNPYRKAVSKSLRNISPARLAAFEILLKIEKEKAFSSVLLPLYETKLDAKDRALCHELTLGVLRWQIFLDKSISRFAGEKIKKLDIEVLIALRLAAYQLIFLDKIPAFAAINEAVNTVYKFKKASAGGFVNAVLRKISLEKTFEFEYTDDLEKVSIETSHPRWLIKYWSAEFGFETASAIASANNQTAPLAFRLTASSNEKTVETLKKLGAELKESAIVPESWRIVKNNEMMRIYAEEGKIYFQEEASQLAGRAVNLQSDEKFLDVCAAPGSKTTYAANAIFQASGSQNSDSAKTFSGFIAAGDKYSHRMRVLAENIKRNGVENLISLVTYDAEKALPFAEESFDCVLVDAPCSGTGTIRHNPEIRYFLKEEDFCILSDKQLKILENASKLVKKGGRLIYSTCSLEKIENELVLEKFLAVKPNFRVSQLDVPSKYLTTAGFARLYPHRDDTDGFFIAQFVNI